MKAFLASLTAFFGNVFNTILRWWSKFIPFWSTPRGGQVSWLLIAAGTAGVVSWLLYTGIRLAVQDNLFGWLLIAVPVYLMVYWNYFIALKIGRVDQKISDKPMWKYPNF